MPPLRLGPNDLLEYEAHYGVLICRECQYAIQKSALQSHLLRHKIYREQRHGLLASIAKLDIFEPDDVPIPEISAPAVSALPIIHGYRCLADGCGNLCASSKRMKRHRSEAHGLDENEVFADLARPAKLQTFFRGTKIRYFEVTSGRQGVVEPKASYKKDGNELIARGVNTRVNDEEELDVQMVEEPSLLSRTTTHPEFSPRPPPVNIDMEIMTYFHHYTTVTSLTLPAVEPVRPASEYWQSDVVLLALRTRWLMCGLLAISAVHLAVLTRDTVFERGHREQLTQLFSEFTMGWKDSDEMDEKSMATGEQIRRILRCTRDFVIPHHVCRTEVSTEDSMHGQDITFPYADRISDAVNMSRTSITHTMTLSAALERLNMLPTRMMGVFGRPDSTRDVLVILAAISALAKCCSNSFASTDARVALREMESWLEKVPDSFHPMVSNHDPAALVVIAHWAAMLIRRAERCGCWFLRDSTEAVLGYVETWLPKDYIAVWDLVKGLQ